LSYKAWLLALGPLAACALAVFAGLSPWVLVGALGCVALVRAAAAFRRELHKLDRILLEELGPVDDRISAPVEITSRVSRASVSRLSVQPTSRLHQAS
jgi:hypothetical protein